MNFKHMSVKEISRMVSTLNHPQDIEEAIRTLSALIDSFKILKSMLEGRMLLQREQEQLERRKGLRVVKKEKMQDT